VLGNLEQKIVSHFNFQIQSNGPVSEKFLERGISDFSGASSFVRNLAYGRNRDKLKLLNVFEENCGTCGTKHALLKKLCDENSIAGVQLMCGIYKMGGNNTPDIGEVLSKHKMEFIPEAHNYLRINEKILDCTFKHSSGENFESYLLTEIEFQPQQIGEFKIKLHKAFLGNWLKENSNFNLDELWSIRESCIRQLSENKTSIA
jgi:hypothetical protein